MGVVIALIVICYLVFLIDWKEMREVLRLGGWAAVAIYIIVGIFIYSALLTPAAVTTMEMHP
jgi:amino acid permease